MSELTALARDIAKSAATVAARSVAVVEASALAVKTEARANAKESSGVHAAQYPDTITYSAPGLNGPAIESEIGPERRGQGNLGPILENGSIHNPPHRDLGRALDAEEPRFIEAAAKLALPWH